MGMKNPAQVTDKWLRNLQGSTQAYTDGVNAVSVAPGEMAAQAAERMLARLIEVVQSGDYAAAARAVGLEEWKQLTISKGAARLSSGAAAAKPKMQRFLSEFLPYLEQNASRLSPRGTKEDNKLRMIEQFEINSAFKMPK